MIIIQDEELDVSDAAPTNLPLTEHVDTVELGPVVKVKRSDGFHLQIYSETDRKAMKKIMHEYQMFYYTQTTLVTLRMTMDLKITALFRKHLDRVPTTHEIKGVLIVLYLG